MNANGWAEPAFQGCDDPLDTGAVNWGEASAHFRQKAGEPADRQRALFQDLFNDLVSAVPELRDFPPFAGQKPAPPK